MEVTDRLGKKSKFDRRSLTHEAFCVRQIRYHNLFSTISWRHLSLVFLSLFPGYLSAVIRAK